MNPADLLNVKIGNKILIINRWKRNGKFFY